MWWFKVEICILFVHIFECVHLHLLKKYVYLYIYIYMYMYSGYGSKLEYPSDHKIGHI